MTEHLKDDVYFSVRHILLIHTEYTKKWRQSTQPRCMASCCV